MLFHKDYAARSMLFDTLVMRELAHLPTSAFFHEADALITKARRQHDKGVELEMILWRYIYMEDHRLINVDGKIAALEKLLAELNRDKYPEYAAVIMQDL